MAIDVMNRRRFLVLVGGAGGAALVGSRALADVGARPESGTAPLEVVAVETGFVDATVWEGELVTMRPSALGATLRFERESRDVAVAIPVGFGARCVGAHGRVLIIGGHRVLEDAPVSFKAGPSYSGLLEAAGDQSALLAAQPSPPEQPVAHSHIAKRHHPALYASSDLSDWKLIDMPSSRYSGGAVGAILEQAGLVAVNGFVDDEVPDSASAVELVALDGAAQGRSIPQHTPLAASHGALWGTAQAPGSELVVVSDLYSIRAMTVTGGEAFRLPLGHQLLAVNVVGQSYEVALRLPAGQRQIMTVAVDGTTRDKALDSDTLIRHGVSPDVVVASVNGLYNTILRKTETKPEGTRQ